MSRAYSPSLALGKTSIPKLKSDITKVKIASSVELRLSSMLTSSPSGSIADGEV